MIKLLDETELKVIELRKESLSQAGFTDWSCYGCLEMFQLNVIELDKENMSGHIDSLQLLLYISLLPEYNQWLIIDLLNETVRFCLVGTGLRMSGNVHPPLPPVLNTVL